ncbi:hypothetical protein Hypma_000827 [Hypsizygus marmoreus]|uniref:G-patch domain-containing protein n=1 Tax=Hypsizygus marmoreus TaxID=39966 RepID=A0A369JB47_HYPMA|nr:hypothetical protein Hypma_000827 [Hypsizygus marmoreus]
MPLDGHSYLVSQGWAGKGTGLRHGAISRPLAIPQKKNLAGLGKDRDESFPFWDHLFSAAAKSIQLKVTSDDDDESDADSATLVFKRTETGILSNRRPVTGISSTTSGTCTPDAINETPRSSLLTIAKRDAAKRGLYARFYRGPVLGPDTDDIPCVIAKSACTSMEFVAVHESVEVTVTDERSKKRRKRDNSDDDNPKRKSSKKRPVADGGDSERKMRKREKKEAKELRRKERREAKEKRKQEKESKAVQTPGIVTADAAEHSDKEESEKLAKKQRKKRKKELGNPKEDVDVLVPGDAAVAGKEKRKRKKPKDTTKDFPSTEDKNPLIATPDSEDGQGEIGRQKESKCLDGDALQQPRKKRKRKDISS